MANWIELTREPIDSPAWLDKVRSHQAGAVLLFAGTVRELTENRQTIALDYQAYEPMALAKMQELAEQAHQRWPIIHLAIIHRLGHLELGETSIVIAVSTPHRRASFEAGQFLIDQFKIVVPIWKQENWGDGTKEWVHPSSPG